MVDTIRRYVDATVAVAVMALLGIMSGVVAAGLTGDSKLTVLAAVVAFVLTGVVLMVRLWRMTRRPVLPPGPAV